MTTEDKNDIKELLQLTLQGEHARNDADHAMLGIKLDSIDKHLANINGSVQKHEHRINEALADRDVNRSQQRNFIETRALTCPKNEKLNTIEDDVSELKTLKHYMVKTVAFFAALVTFIMGIVKYLTD